MTLNQFKDLPDILRESITAMAITDVTVTIVSHRVEHYLEL